MASGQEAESWETLVGPSRGQSATPIAAQPEPLPERNLNTAELAILQPRRNIAMWLICVALVGVTVLTLIGGAYLGTLLLAGVHILAGTVRAVVPGAVIGISVRSRPVDLVLYFGLALAMIFLAQTAPNI